MPQLLRRGGLPKITVILWAAAAAATRGGLPCEADPSPAGECAPRDRNLSIILVSDSDDTVASSSPSSGIASAQSSRRRAGDDGVWAQPPRLVSVSWSPVVTAACHATRCVSTRVCTVYTVPHTDLSVTQPLLSVTQLRCGITLRYDITRNYVTLRYVTVKSGHYSVICQPRFARFLFFNPIALRLLGLPPTFPPVRRAPERLVSPFNGW